MNPGGGASLRVARLPFWGRRLPPVPDRRDFGEPLGSSAFDGSTGTNRGAFLFSRGRRFGSCPARGRVAASPAAPPVRTGQQPIRAGQASSGRGSRSVFGPSRGRCRSCRIWPGIRGSIKGRRMGRNGLFQPVFRPPDRFFRRKSAGGERNIPNIPHRKKICRKIPPAA